MLQPYSLVFAFILQTMSLSISFQDPAKYLSCPCIPSTAPFSSAFRCVEIAAFQVSSSNPRSNGEVRCAAQDCYSQQCSEPTADRISVTPCDTLTFVEAREPVPEVRNSGSSVSKFYSQLLQEPVKKLHTHRSHHFRLMTSSLGLGRRLLN